MASDEKTAPAAVTLPPTVKLPLAVILPPAWMFPVAVSLPEIFKVLPLCDKIELVIVALPPLLANTGTSPVLQAVLDAQKIDDIGLGEHGD